MPTWDAVLLDLGLPDGDGLEVARELRAAGGTPVLIVTARDEVSSRVEGLDAGADDYLVKPFDRAELLARLRALLRRSAPANQGPILVEDLVVDAVHRTVRRGTRLVQVTPLEFELLAYLGQRPGTPVSARGAARERLAPRSVGAHEHGRGVRLEPAPQDGIRRGAAAPAHDPRRRVRARCVTRCRSGGASRC